MMKRFTIRHFIRTSSTLVRGYTKDGFHKKVLLLGAPGVGKGTYASRACKELAIPHVTSGDIIRDHLKNDTAIGKECRAFMEAGDLIPDDMMTDIMVDTLSDLIEHDSGFILDGYPRTLNQAKELHERLGDVDQVINLTQRDDIILAKITNRRVCSECGHTYNLAHIKEEGLDMPPLLPKVDGICDECGAKDSLFQRDDDRLDIVKNRLHVYNELTSPLIQYYKNLGQLDNFKVSGGAKALLPSFMDLLTKKKKE